MPEISIIVPVYNVEAYLHRCINSILSQSFQDFELILIDDGSPDNCGAICDEYASKDRRVYVIHQANGGVSSARNAGLDAAVGRYIMFVDSDDKIVPGFLMQSVNAMHENQLDIYLAGLSVIGETGKTFYTSAITEERFSYGEKLSPELFTELLQSSYISSSWAKLYSRRLIGDTRFDTGLCFGEDLKFVWTLLLKAPRIIASPKTGYLYYNNPNSATHLVPTVEKCRSIVQTYQFIFSFDKVYWSQREAIFLSFCQKRWQADYIATIRQIVYAQLPIQKKISLFRIMYGDSDLRHHLSKQGNGSFIPYWLWYKSKMKKALNRLKRKGKKH